MSLKHFAFCGAAVAAFVGGSGCKTCCHGKHEAPPPSFVPGSPPPPSRGDLILPAQVPPSSQPFPPSSRFPDVGMSLGPATTAPPGDSRSSNFPPAVTIPIVPEDSGLRLGEATTTAPGSSTDLGLRLGQAQTSPPGHTPAPATMNIPGTPPAGLPGFAKVNEQVTAGGRPTLDGLDWLKANGYRTVVFVHAPGVDDSTDRSQVTKLGLRYQSVELSSLTLGDQVATDFSQSLTDPSGHKVYVYDDDRALAAVLFYVHFRTVEKQGIEAARQRAQRLGLKEIGTDEQTALFLAAQNYISRRSSP